MILSSFINKARSDPKEENQKTKSSSKNKAIRQTIPSNIISAWVQPH